ncbi:hypothetical protein PAPYR_1295 [Paratrimastix pyriformis]|uniref:RWP-RK domain-containing protein n=1 Tax=Paratrimastix pyriformis TaxID=342808 RepID=A0ABQ8USK3_9EUKA|nr:hypothetical protein PAPYR_1295 [Paratrimastix pyriformis]
MGAVKTRITELALVLSTQTGPKIALGKDQSNPTLDDLRLLFDLPIKEAAAKLGMCVTILKKHCRTLGVQRWPFRQLRSLDSIISALQNSDAQAALEDGTPVYIRLALLREERAQVIANPNHVPNYTPLPTPKGTAILPDSSSSALRTPVAQTPTRPALSVQGHGQSTVISYPHSQPQSVLISPPHNTVTPHSSSLSYPPGGTSFYRPAISLPPPLEGALTDPYDLSRARGEWRPPAALVSLFLDDIRAVLAHNSGVPSPS